MTDCHQLVSQAQRSNRLSRYKASQGIDSTSQPLLIHAAQKGQTNIWEGAAKCKDATSEPSLACGFSVLSPFIYSWNLTPSVRLSLKEKVAKCLPYLDPPLAISSTKQRGRASYKLTLWNLCTVMALALMETTRGTPSNLGVTSSGWRAM